jgi:hypothetical protein
LATVGLHDGSDHRSDMEAHWGIGDGFIEQVKRFGKEGHTATLIMSYMNEKTSLMETTRVTGIKLMADCYLCGDAVGSNAYEGRKLGSIFFCRYTNADRPASRQAFSWMKITPRMKVTLNKIAKRQRCSLESILLGNRSEERFLSLARGAANLPAARFNGGDGGVSKCTANRHGCGEEDNKERMCVCTWKDGDLEAAQWRANKAVPSLVSDGVFEGEFDLAKFVTDEDGVVDGDKKLPGCMVLVPTHWATNRDNGETTFDKEAFPRSRIPADLLHALLGSGRSLHTQV